MSKTKVRAKRRSTRKRKKPMPPDVMEFLGHIQRMERENVPILPDHPPLH